MGGYMLCDSALLNLATHSNPNTDCDPHEGESGVGDGVRREWFSLASEEPIRVRALGLGLRLDLWLVLGL